MIDECSISCGVRQLYNFDSHGTPTDFLLDSLEQSDDFYYSGVNSLVNYRFFIFSDKISKEYEGSGLTGTQFAKFVTKNKLGTLSMSAVRRNPNSGSNIRVWVWDIDRPALYKWYLANKISDEDDQEE